jgi:hypothetical protein
MNQPRLLAVSFAPHSSASLRLSLSLIGIGFARGRQEVVQYLFACLYITKALVAVKMQMSINDGIECCGPAVTFATRNNFVTGNV